MSTPWRVARVLSNKHNITSIQWNLLDWQSRDSISIVAPSRLFGLLNRTKWHHTVEIESPDCQSMRDSTVFLLYIFDISCYCLFFPFFDVFVLFKIHSHTLIYGICVIIIHCDYFVSYLLMILDCSYHFFFTYSCHFIFFLEFPPPKPIKSHQPTVKRVGRTDDWPRPPAISRATRLSGWSPRHPDCCRLPGPPWNRPPNWLRAKTPLGPWPELRDRRQASHSPGPPVCSVLPAGRNSWDWRWTRGSEVEDTARWSGCPMKTKAI